MFISYYYTPVAIIYRSSKKYQNTAVATKLDGRYDIPSFALLLLVLLPNFC